MKHPIYSILCLLLFLLPSSLIADDLIAYDGFSGNDYGWSGDWVDGDASNTFSLSVKEVELLYEYGDITVWGGDSCMKAVATKYGNQSKFISKTIDGLDQTFYVSFLMQFSPKPWNDWWYCWSNWNYAAVGKKDNTDDSGVLMGTCYKEKSLGAAFCQNGSKYKYIDVVNSRVSPTVNQTYFVIGKWDCNSSGLITNITIWINPTSQTTESAEYTTSTTYSPDDVMTSIDLQAYFGRTVYFDEMRVGRTWASVVSSIEPVYYSGGSGTESDPYLISNTEDLRDLSNNSEHWNKYFLQTTNIIFDKDSSVVDWNWDGQITSDDAYGFSPIGNRNENMKFSGTYDGQGYRIKNLYVNRNRNSSPIGLFGCCQGATISNVQLTQERIYGLWSVGGLIGECLNGCVVEGCITKGKIEARNPVGGLIGVIAGTTTVSQSYSTCDVYGEDKTGGLVGKLDNRSSSISNCFSRGYVEGIYSAGGLVGLFSGGSIENSYSTGEISARKVGGLVCQESSGSVTNSFWDTETSGTIISAGGTGKDTENMKLESTFIGWDFSDVWSIDEEINDGYPYLIDLESSVTAVVTEFVGSGDWSDEDNWTNGVPDEEEETVVVISGDCEISDSVAVEDIVVSSTGTLTVSDSADLDIEGELTLTSDSAGSAEYVVENTSGSSSVDTVLQKKYFEGGQWSFICVPVDMTADDLFPDLNLATSWSDADGEYWLVEYSQENRATLGSGMESVYDGTHVLEAGLGYMVWVDNDQTGEYKHLVATSASKVDTKYTAGTSENDNGWNLVGNPFTHTMTYDDVFDCPHNAKYFTGAVYLWDGKGYKTWVGTTGDAEASVIKPMEAFFVKRTNSDSASAYFCMAKGDCDCSVVETKAASILTSTEDISEYADGVSIGISPESGVCTDYTYINAYTSDSEDAFSDEVAVKIENSNDDKDIIYSTYNDESYAVNSFSLEESSSLKIPLVLDLSSSKETVTMYYELSGDENCTFYLVDELNSDSVVLSKFDNLTYSIDEETLIFDRFSLSIVKNNDLVTDILSHSTDKEECVEIKTTDNLLTVTSIVDDDLSIAVYDILGRKIDESQLSANGTYEKVVNCGVYVLQVKSGAEYYGTKFIMR